MEMEGGFNYLLGKNRDIGQRPRVAKIQRYGTKFKACNLSSELDGVS